MISPDVVAVRLNRVDGLDAYDLWIVGYAKGGRESLVLQADGTIHPVPGMVTFDCPPTARVPGPWGRLIQRALTEGGREVFTSQEWMAYK